MECDKNNKDYNFSDLEELNDYEIEKEKIAGFDFDALDFEESKKENLKQQESSSRTEKKSGRASKKRRVLSKVDYEKLIGPDGLVKLKEQGPKLKFKDSKKSKSATIDNLRIIVNFYQTWAHGLCPQMKFKDVIFQSENVCKEKRLKHYLDILREEAKNRQVERNDYLSGKTLADEESVFWNTPSQSASRSKRVPSFKDKLIEDQNNDDLIVTPRLLFTSEDDMLNIGSYPLDSLDSYLDELDEEDEILSDSQGVLIKKGENGIFEDSCSLGESRDGGLRNNMQASNMKIDQVYEDPTLTNLSPETNSDTDKSILHIYKDDDELSLTHGEVSNVCARDLCKDHNENDIIDTGSDKENLQPNTSELPMSKQSTLFFDLGDKYVDLTPIYEEVNDLDVDLVPVYEENNDLD